MFLRMLGYLGLNDLSDLLKDHLDDSQKYIL